MDFSGRQPSEGEEELGTFVVNIEPEGGRIQRYWDIF